MKTYIPLSLTALLGILFSITSLLQDNTGLFFRFSLNLYFLIITPAIFIFWRILDDRNKKENPSKHPLRLFFPFLSIAITITFTVFPDLFIYSRYHDGIFCTSFISTMLLAAHIISVVYALYLLENIYRYAHLYQRRIGFVSFSGFLIIILHQLVFTTRFLLYSWISVSWIKFAALLYIIPLCAVLWSFSRYRIGLEKIKVTREAMYSSFSLLIVGALFTSVGITTLIFRKFNIQISPFDIKVLSVTALFSFTIIAGSARMRRRVAKFINRRIYPQKYDYRSQFFSLYRTLGRTEGYAETLEDVLEHLRRMINAEHAYLFISDEQNGNFKLLPPKERSLPDSVIIKNESPLISTLLKKGDYFGLLRITDDPAMTVKTDNQVAFSKLQISHIAPVFHYDDLLAILTLRCDDKTSFDTETKAVIESYASVISDLLFKHRILIERLEQKQFESFSHMASFIVHDVKNQVSTLKLLFKNAEKNISDPRFQESLLVSLRNCTEDLGNLVQKLSMPPSRNNLKIIRGNVIPLIEKLINDAGLNIIDTVEFTKDLAPELIADFDENALYYTLKNLVVNAIDSMECRNGKLIIKALPLKSSLSWLNEKFPDSEALFTKHDVLIAVEDTGCGMSEEFLRNRLYRPFSTTKDKGIGIGLYQCKTLIEKMGGKIICSSQINCGTLFCIIL